MHRSVIGRIEAHQRKQAEFQERFTTGDQGVVTPRGGLDFSEPKGARKTVPAHCYRRNQLSLTLRWLQGNALRLR
ncbi:MAG: hypothetical protein AB7V46_25170 [Thermomicrobiales bacterium]